MAIAAILVPLAASAQTTDVQSQIQALLSQIKALQQQLATLLQQQGGSGEHGPWMMGSTTPPQGGDQVPPGQAGNAACIALNRNLGIGSQGEDVKQVQQMLAEDPEDGFTGSATGFFGPLTAHAMMHFQERFGIASSTNGSVGPLTRDFFDHACAKGYGEGPHATGHVAGTISAGDTSSITVTTGNGQTRVVTISASTSIEVFAGTTTPPTAGTIANLTVGSVVSADGEPQSDGSLAAEHVQVGVAMPQPQSGEGHWNAKDFMQQIQDHMFPQRDGQSGGEGPHGMMQGPNGQQGGQGDN
jgi:peptidoglycan hydrolase-like protein with peptidoglycan-binding domain